MTSPEIIANKANLRGANLWGADLSKADLSEATLSEATLCGANLRGANLRGADLSRANLSRANLHGTDLSEADLSSANLRGADLSGADLSGADLRGAVGYDPYQIQPLYTLRRQDGPITAYKIVSSAYESPYQHANPISYTIGATVQIPIEECDPDEHELCGKGLHVATLQWCLSALRLGRKRIVQVVHDPSDIVAIPHASDGKYRVCKLTVVKDVAL